MAWDVVVRTFYTDSGLSAGLARANEQLRQLSRTGPGAGAGVRAVEQGARALALQAVGLPGPLGRVATGLLQLGGGSALVLAAVAGIGAIGAAVRALTRDARDNAEAQKKMFDELRNVGPHGQAVAARAEIAKLEELQTLPFGERLKRVGKAFVGPLLGGETLEEQNQAIERRIAELRIIIAKAERELEEPSARLQRLATGRLAVARLELRQAGLGPEPQIGLNRLDRAEEVRRLELEQDPQTRGVAAEVARQERIAAGLDLRREANERLIETQFEAELRANNLTDSEEALAEAIRAHRLALEGLEPAVARYIAHEERVAATSIKSAEVLRTQLPQAFAAMGRAATQSMDAVVQSAISSITQMIQAMPGISPATNAVLGFVTGILGGLFNRRDPMPVEVTNADELRAEGPDRFSIQIISESTGALIDEIEYELGRRARLDRIIRIPRRVRILD